MKLLFIFHEFGYSCPSLYASLTDFVSVLAKRGHEVHVLTLIRNIKGAIPKNVILHGISDRVPIDRIAKIMTKTRNIVKNYKIEHIHVHSLGFYALPICLLKNFLKITCSFWNCGLERKFMYDDFRISHIFLLLSFKLCDILITGTRLMKNYYELNFNIPSERIAVMPNSISKKLNSNIEASYLKKRLKLTDKKILLYIHRLSKRKGPQHLIEAMKGLSQKYNNLVLLMIGNGPLYSYLEGKISDYKLNDHVFLLGAIPNRLIPHYLAISDILVIPSEEEGFPRVLIEGMAMGKPIVATNVGGVSEVSLGNRTALLIPPKDIQKLVDAISKLLEDTNFAKKLGENARRIALENYTHKKVSIRFLKIIADLRLGVKMR